MKEEFSEIAIVSLKRYSGILVHSRLLVLLYIFLPSEMFF